MCVTKEMLAHSRLHCLYTFDGLRTPIRPEASVEQRLKHLREIAASLAIRGLRYRNDAAFRLPHDPGGRCETGHLWSSRLCGRITLLPGFVAVTGCVRRNAVAGVPVVLRGITYVFRFFLVLEQER